MNTIYDEEFINRAFKVKPVPHYIRILKAICSFTFFGFFSLLFIAGITDSKDPVSIAGYVVFLSLTAAMLYTGFVTAKAAYETQERKEFIYEKVKEEKKYLVIRAAICSIIPTTFCIAFYSEIGKELGPWLIGLGVWYLVAAIYIYSSRYKTQLTKEAKVIQESDARIEAVKSALSSAPWWQRYLMAVFFIAAGVYISEIKHGDLQPWFTGLMFLVAAGMAYELSLLAIALIIGYFTVKAIIELFAGFPIPVAILLGAIIIASAIKHRK